MDVIVGRGGERGFDPGPGAATGDGVGSPTGAAAAGAGRRPDGPVPGGRGAAGGHHHHHHHHHAHHPPGRGLHASVLVLNKHYLPIHLTSARRAFVLLYKRDAEAISLVDERIACFDFTRWLDFSTLDGDPEADYVATVAYRIKVPRIVRLLAFERLPVGRVNFTRRNVLARDEYRCQYCGVRASPRDLTIDHVVPRSRGGKHCWTNVVAACARCNDRKGQLTLREASMALLREPAVPKRAPELKRKLEESRYRVWKIFLGRQAE